MGILSSIRQKPDHQKKIISLVLALILTFFIVGLWFSFTSNSGNQVVAGNQDKLSSVSPFQVIKDEFSKAFSGFGSTSSPQVILDSSSTIPIEIIEATSTASTTEN